MRIKIRKPMTDYAKSLAVAELARLAADDHPPGAVLDQSIFSDWQGLFPPKDQENGQQRQHRNQSSSSYLDAKRQAIEPAGCPEQSGPVAAMSLDGQACPGAYPGR